MQLPSSEETPRLVGANFGWCCLSRLSLGWLSRNCWSFDGLGLGDIRTATNFVRVHFAAVLTMATATRAEPSQLAAKSVKQTAAAPIVSREQAMTMAMSTQATEEMSVVAKAVVLQSKDAAPTRIASSGIAPAVAARSSNRRFIHSATAIAGQTVRTGSTSCSLRKLEHPQTSAEATVAT